MGVYREAHPRHHLSVMRGGVRVEGLRETIRSLEAVGVQVADLRQAFGAIAKEARSLAAGYAPRRSGALQRSIRASTSKNYAAVTAGSSKVPYAAPINYGWEKRHIVGAGFMQRADAAIRPHVLRDLQEALDRLLRERHLQ